jgi:hypothetical protein
MAAAPPQGISDAMVGQFTGFCVFQGQILVSTVFFKLVVQGLRK